MDYYLFMIICYSCKYVASDHQHQVCIQVEQSGNFQLQMVLEDGRVSGVGYFLVEPVLSESFPLSAVICETVLTKNLGKFSRWKAIFDNIQQCNYNMIHFTPVQELGESRSCYSIANHERLTDQLNNEAENLTEEEKEERLANFINGYADKEMYSICDVVWNHTATNTPWLAEKLDASYNLGNSPHMRPAYTLDNALKCISKKLAREKELLTTTEDVEHVISDIERRILPSLRLWEFFVINVPKEVSKFRDILESGQELPMEHEHHPFASDLTSECICKGDGTRGSITVRMSCVYQIFKNSKDSIDQKCLAFRRTLERYNSPFYENWKEDQRIILQSLRSHLIYERVDPTGPRYVEVNEETPLFPNYFTTLKDVPFSNVSSGFNYDDNFMEMPLDGANNIACANAGWVFGAENTLDITSEENRIYLRRQLVAWTDSVKLRFGSKPADSPFLWNYMAKYTRQIAKLFHGIRIDNCHSTPLHVAKTLLQEARSIRPNLFVSAELFTEPQIESNYVEQLGLTCLIREAMQANDLSHLCNKFYDYSGAARDAIGALFPASVRLGDDPYYSNNEMRVYLSSQISRNIFMECTHDNQPPAVQRTLYDALPNATIVALSDSAIGSMLGYDQLVPHHIHVVDETRTYPEDTPGGIECCKSLLNSLHVALANHGYTEFGIHQDGDLVFIVRHNPDNHKSVYSLIHTAFTKRGALRTSFPSFPYYGEFVQELFVGLIRTDNIPFERDPDHINGFIPALYWPHSGPINSQTHAMYELKNNSIYPTKFPPGSILGFSTTLPAKVEQAKMKLQAPEMEEKLKQIISKFSLVDLNKILYSCPAEEGIGSYGLGGWGNMSYCGIAGVVLCFNTVDKKDPNSHPVCHNLREGSWLMDYTADRLKDFPELQRWLRKVHSLLKEFTFLRPKYFHWHITRVYHFCIQHACSLMSPFIQHGNSFTKALAMCSVQVYGNISSAPMRYLEKCLEKSSPSLSAGLPHFSNGYMRTWGRDTFIALRGLMLVTGRFDEALDLITGFASCLRHGMIPNLLDSGKHPRYNARDATWWFTQAVQDYCEFVYPNDPKGAVTFLNTTELERYFTVEEITAVQIRRNDTLGDILREILQKHAKGIAYREWNAGPQLDDHMTDEGFDVSEYLDPETGFLCGGSLWNCGTWMDKMGGSKQHGNLGIPATPRDGADIEIIGLLASTLRWLSSLEEHGFTCPAVTVGKSGTMWTLKQWHSKIKENFETKFWIPEKGDNDGDYDINFDLISRRGVYKDTVGASDPNNDYHFRPNQCIALVVAPELFDKSHALKALSKITKNLLGKLGMKTLDPGHPNYSPYYDPGSTKNFFEAEGLNYHQGPVSTSFKIFIPSFLINILTNIVIIGMGLDHWILFKSKITI